ncbi:MAG: glycosyltransferase family 4 protein, partial [Acidobacteriota bacterium]|nr:glycosyltransferase family 4 protein [Acidobacteriota bacterium]
MRILQISSAKTFGGGEKHFVDLSRGLTTRGHEVFAALRPTNQWQEKLDFLPPESILHVSLRNSFGVLSAQKIAEFIREKNIEIVHAHAARDYIPASLACRIAKNARFVLTRHVLFPLKPFHR